MNITYIPMGSMQVGPNGELIPTNIATSFPAGAEGRGPTFHQVVTTVPGSNAGWKMSDLTPVYSGSHNFAVMEPLAVSSGATVVPVSHLAPGTNVAMTGAMGGQLVQAPGGGAHIVHAAAGATAEQFLQVATLQAQQHQQQMHQQQKVAARNHKARHKPVPPLQFQQIVQQHQPHFQIQQIPQHQVQLAQPQTVHILHPSAPTLESRETQPSEEQQQESQPQQESLQNQPNGPSTPQQNQEEDGEPEGVGDEGSSSKKTEDQTTTTDATPTTSLPGQPILQEQEPLQQVLQVMTPLKTISSAGGVTGYTIIKVDNGVAIPGEGQILTHPLDLPTTSVASDAVVARPTKPRSSSSLHFCPVCAKDFRSKGNLKRHHKDFHETSAQRVTYHCDLCRKDFQNRFNLRRHRVGVHGGTAEFSVREFQCEVCSKIFHYNDNLKRHRRNVHGLMPRREIKWEAGAEYSGTEPTDGAADNSFSVVEDTKPALSGVDAAALVPVSPNSRAFVCEICNKNLQSNYNLKRHQAAVHKDTRILYGCDECEKNFTSITNYRRHKVMIHGPGKQAYRCAACEKNLASKDGLRRHMESVHQTIGKNFVCGTCGNRFLRKEYLTKHLKTHQFNYEILPADTTTTATPLSPDAAS